jgi:hypothetical protein
MVEPSEVNHDRHVRVFRGRSGGRSNDNDWRPLLAWEKDALPLRFFQYGNALLPDGDNRTEYLAVTTVAVKADDFTLSLYSVEG